MGWLKLDDKFPRNPKILAGDSTTAWFYVCALSHCAEQMTDGYIADSAVLVLAPHIEDPRSVAEQCADLDLFRRVEGGYQMTGFRTVRHADGMWVGAREAAVRPSWWRPSRPKMPAGLRAAVLDRDGHTCRRCGATDDLEIDHIYPWSLGGSFDDPANLQTLCGTCNRRKGTRVED
jgi:5-methylcytosine-specific restriction endonuclease McrA